MAINNVSATNALKTQDSTQAIAANDKTATTVKNNVNLTAAERKKEAVARDEEVRESKAEKINDEDDRKNRETEQKRTELMKSNVARDTKTGTNIDRIV